ncbi:MAG: polysaccharide biosynthesis tyrosine autokinase [Planctomycetota bacterium]
MSANSGGGGFDIWGPLQRRKYLIALFCLIGAGAGYLYYVNSPKTYSSTTRLMITTQAPPTMLDGDMRLSRESLDKHVSLIASELILKDASKNGRFERLEVFKDTSYPVNQLRSMIRVVPETKETLSIVCTGSNPDDLPQILNQIVSSYRKTIKEDSQAIGQKTVDLIQRLANRLNEEKQDAVNERDMLWQQLNIQAIDKDGFAVNPHNRPLAQLQTQLDSLRLQLTEVQDRFRLLEKNLEIDPEKDEIDPVKLGIAALEARDYLKLVERPFKEEAMGGDRVVRNLAPEFQQRQSLQQKIWNIESKIVELNFTRTEYSTKYGSGHSKIEAIDNQIAYYDTQRRDTQAELMEVEKKIEIESQRNEEENPEDNVQRMDLATFRLNEQREWVSKYFLRLRQEQEQIAAKINRVETQINTVSKKAQAAATKIIRLNKLQDDFKQKSAAVTAITDKLSEMDILNNNYTMTSVKELDEAKRGVKVAPSLPKSLALGTMLAFLAGLGLAILVDQSELAFRNPAEIFERLQVPVVGRIPRINTRNIEAKTGHQSLIAAHKPSATASESFRDVRTALFFRANHDGIKTILFTSPSPGDGKSTTVSNLAISIAQAGKKVVLVDADFRRPRVHQYFGQELNPGLMDVLNGEMPLKQAIQKAELQENLFLVPSGGRPRNPGELVTSEAFRNLIEALREKFDYVLIDSPPVLPVSDPATIASLVDGVYLVTRIRKGVKLTSQKAKETLDRVGANWMGVIVNGLDENPHYSEYGYQYGNYSYYGGMYGRYYESNNKIYRDKIGS